MKSLLLSTTSSVLLLLLLLLSSFNSSAAEEENEGTGNKWTDAIKDFFTDERCLRTEKDVTNLKDLSTWVSQIDTKTKFIDLILPGSHNSVAYDLSTIIFKNDPNYELVQDGITTIGLPEEYFAQWFCSYALTQSLSISEQLQAGIRYLDISIDYDVTSSTFKGVHMLFTQETASELLLQVSTFLQLYTKEIVVIEISSLDYPDMTNELFIELQTLLLEEDLSSLLVPSTTNLEQITIGELIDNNTRLFLIVNDDELLVNDKIWKKSNIIMNDGFPNTDILQDMIDYNTNQVEIMFQQQQQNNNKLNKLQWILTPSKDYIRNNPLSGSLYALAESANAKLQDFVSNVQQEQQQSLFANIVIVDYIETSSIFKILDLEQYSIGDFLEEEVDDESMWTGAAKAGMIVGILLLLCGCCLIRNFCKKKKN